MMNQSDQKECLSLHGTQEAYDPGLLLDGLLGVMHLK